MGLKQKKRNYADVFFSEMDLKCVVVRASRVEYTQHQNTHFVNEPIIYLVLSQFRL